MRILLVDGDESYAALVERSLRPAGLRVVRRADYHAALAALKASAEFDLVVVDTHLPGGRSGLEFVPEVRRHLPRCPLVLTSSVFQEDDEVVQSLLVEWDVDRFQQRPLALLELPDLLKAVVASRQRFQNFAPPPSGAREETPRPSPPVAVSSTPPAGAEGSSSPTAHRRVFASAGAAPAPAPLPGSVPGAVENPLLLLKRLRREQARLAESPDSVVLGLRRDASPDEVDRALGRQEAYFSGVMVNPAYSDEVHRLAGLIMERARTAAHAMRTGTGRRELPAEAPGDREAQAFQAGQDAVKRGDFARARRAFKAAHMERVDDARLLAWLGWATLHDPSLGTKARHSEGHELLQLAEQLDMRSGEIQVFLAEAEALVGETDRAIHRLERELGREERAHLRALLERLQAGRPRAPAG